MILTILVSFILILAYNLINKCILHIREHQILKLFKQILRTLKMLDEETETQISDNESFKMFEFFRIRNNNTKKDNKIVEGLNDTNNTKTQNKDEIRLYRVPKKRSGHRAVCDDDNLWIWGGYSPYENEDTDSERTSPMLPEVRHKFIT